MRARGYTVCHTTGPKRAGAIAAAHCEKHKSPAVVLIGGDGTVFESIESLPLDVPLGVFPSGTVNLLARALDIPGEIATWLALLERGSLRPMYFARCNGRPFTCVGSAGFDAETLRHVKPQFKKTLQEAAIGLEAFRRYWRHKPSSYRVTLDDTTVSGPFVGVFFGLQPYYGGRHRIMENAHTERRELDVGLLRGGHKRALWRYAIGVRTGRLPRQQGCELRKATRLRIEADPPTSVQLDGDFYCETPIEIEVEKTPRLVLAAG